MLKVFLASHAHLASGILSSLRLFSNPRGRLVVHDAYVDGEDVPLREHLDEFYNGLDVDDDVLLLSDLYGGSVNAVMAEYLGKPRTRLVAGVNLAFVLEVMSHEVLSDSELGEIIAQARLGLREVSAADISAVSVNEDEFF